MEDEKFMTRYGGGGGWHKLLKSGNLCFSHFYGQVNVRLRLVDQIGWRDGKAVDLQFKGSRFEYR
jgi:hypothetical protein